MNTRRSNTINVNARIELLEKIRIKFGLNRLLDYGAPMSDEIYYPVIESIEINTDITGPGIFNGDYLTLLPEHLGNNTCYTCFVFLSEIKPENTERLISEYKEIKRILFDANLTNSFFVLWIRSEPGPQQQCVIYDLENKVDITESFATV